MARTMKRKLSLGVQEFTKIRKNDYVYVDKTALIYQLATEGESYFLSRPRRFGKSLLISTMEAYFSGREELFEGLAIHDLEQAAPADSSGEAWVKGPVIHLDFSTGDWSGVEEMRETLREKLWAYEKIWGADPEIQILPLRFYHLIETMHQATGIRVAVLIDEYDKPLLQYMYDEKRTEALRTELKSFLTVLKSAGAHTKFVFITGVTKFSHVSIFSDLNQLRDISMDPQFNTICGMTKSEMEDSYQAELAAFAAEEEKDPEQLLRELAAQYDGYLFSRRGERLFNPYSLLSALQQKRFANYWFDSATPTFLVQTVQQSGFEIPKFGDGIRALEEEFMSYRADPGHPLPLLYQSGYLTIRQYDPQFRLYTLGFPNNEVKYSFLNCLLPFCTNIPEGETGLSIAGFVSSIEEGDVDAFMQRLKSLLASVKYDDSRGADKALRYEYTWHTALYLIFTLCGQYFRSEVHMAGGRSDGIMEMADLVYIFEFKMAPASAADALAQIEKNQYAAPYAASGKRIVRIGVVFDAQTRGISDYAYE